MLENFFGIDWPKGDPARCRHAAELWREMAKHVDVARTAIHQATGKALQTSRSGALDAFANDVATYENALTGLAEALSGLAKALDEYAHSLDEVRHKLIVIAEEVAADIAATIAFGFVTGGLDTLVSGPVLAALGVRAVATISTFAEFAAFIVSRLAYYAVDSAVYAALDQGAIMAVDAANGEPVSLSDNLTSAGQIAVANVGYDAAVDGQFAVLNKARGAVAALGPIGRLAGRLPAKAETSVALRAGVRLSSSALAYSPILHAEQGNSDLLPDQSAMEQKMLIHLVGRAAVDKIRFRYGLP